jgi:peptide/nickel transport system substrate-binding protein
MTENDDFGFGLMPGSHEEVMTRRRFAKAAIGAGAAIAGASVLAACGGGGKLGGSSGLTGSSGHPGSSGPAGHGLAELPGGTPVRGGTLTVGALSGGTSETLNPGALVITADFCRCFQLYDFLFTPGKAINPIVPGLALSAESNAAATLWTFHLRDGVVFHNGKAFSADDLVWNFQHIWTDPQNFGHGFLSGLVDFQKVRKRGRLIVEVPLLTPFAAFDTIFSYQNFAILQQGATAKSAAAHPIGTGPFKFESFTPGSQSVFVANKGYWEHGKPHVDKVIVNSSFTDNTSLLNALLAGDVDLFPSLPLVSARQQLASKQMQILESPAAAQTYAFVLRVDKGPMADNRVRTAFKLLLDRQALIDGAFAGFGAPAYDIQGPYCEYYDSGLKRVQDIEKATSLFKSAGVAGHTFTIQTSDAYPGYVESATLLSQQAQKAGIKVVVNQTSASTYYTPAGGFLTGSFRQELNEPWTSLGEGYRADLTKTAPYNETHWGSQPGGKAKEALINKAIAETNKAKAQELWHEVQLQQFNEGGWIWWGNLPYVDAAANRVRGLTAGAGLNYNQWRLLDGWIAA